jgi:Cu-processing system ATP-binding protein
VSFEVARGETLALVGHNGAGKTTLFRLILGFLPTQSGGISVNGFAPGTRNAQREVAYLPESVAFPKTLTGEEIVNFYGRLRGCSKQAARDVLDRVGLADARRRRCGGYSKGMRQRLGLAQALVAAPQLLLLDEPTSGLDPSSRHTFYSLIDEIAATGTAVVLSSHGLNELQNHVQRVAMLSDGHLLACGHLDELLANAGLSLQLLVRGGAIATETIASRFSGRMRRDGRCEIDCTTAEKLAVVRQLLALDAELAELEFRAPGLNELYRHFAAETPIAKQERIT